MVQAGATTSQQAAHEQRWSDEQRWSVLASWAWCPLFGAVFARFLRADRRRKKHEKRAQVAKLAGFHPERT